MTNEISEENQKQDKGNKFGLDMDEMTRAGLYFGHRTSGLHPKMRPFVQGVKNATHIIDLEKTKEKFSEALEFIEELSSKKGVILFVGTKIQTQKLAENAAKDCDMPYINRRWLGGTFTNFAVIKKRTEYLKSLEEQKAKGELEKYTKKEQLKIEDEIIDLKNKFEGIKNLARVPDAIFVCDMKKNSITVKEARSRKIKVIGIVDTNVDPTLADYPIPANDDAVSSVEYILKKVKEVLLRARPVGGEESKENKESVG